MKKEIEKGLFLFFLLLMERSGSIPEGSRIEFKMEGEQNNLSEISFPIYESDPKPENPLKEKWEKLYPPIPKPEYSQVCDGYSCMWCGRCPRGDNWKCPEEDTEIYAQYQKELNAWFDRHSEYFAKAIIQLAKEHKDIMED